MERLEPLAVQLIRSVHVSEPYSKTDRTRDVYRRSFVCRLSMMEFHIPRSQAWNSLHSQRLTQDKWISPQVQQSDRTLKPSLVLNRRQCSGFWFSASLRANPLCWPSPRSSQVRYPNFLGLKWAAQHHLRSLCLWNESQRLQYQSCPDTNVTASPSTSQWRSRIDPERVCSPV